MGADNNIISNTLGLMSDAINESVILSPGWAPDRLFHASQVELLVDSAPLFGYKIWTIHINNCNITYINTGYGAPVVLDAVQLLALTNCKKIVFVSSVGAISSEIGLGDIIVPRFAADGTGTGRFMAKSIWTDQFEEKCYPNEILTGILFDIIRRDPDCVWHCGQTFCLNTIVGQSRFIPELVKKGYNTFDMECAIVFKVCSQKGIASSALLQVSDNSISDQSLLYGIKRTALEKQFRDRQREKMGLFLQKLFSPHNQ